MVNVTNHINSLIDSSKSRISVIGLGYVGLPTAVHFAEQGFSVVGADINNATIEAINDGVCPLTDLDLDERMRAVVDSGKLSATADIAHAVSLTDVVLIIVPTPVRNDRQPDLSYVRSAGESIRDGMISSGPGKLIILESTVYPGVTEDILMPILEESGYRAGVDFGLAYCPERYNPGDVDHTIEKVARIVGGITPEWGVTAQRLYQRIIQEDVTLVKNIRTSEAAKVIENTQRDLNIALMNELSMIFERMGIDIMDVIEAARTKWNFNVYFPGAGVGGHCLPVDPYYLVKKAEELGYHAQIITAGRSINDYMPFHVFEMTVEALNRNKRAVKDSKILILGLSYKENVGDLRESPVKYLVRHLQKMEADITVIDPFIASEKIRAFGVHSSEDIYDAAKDADAVLLVTAHEEFRNIDLRRLCDLMRTTVFIDGRRFYSPHDLQGFTYRAVGRDATLID